MSTINIPEIPGTLVGAATVASLTPGVFMFEDRNDLVVLWGIRVDPRYQQQQRGIGRTLLETVAS
ncbi:MAG: GNAT family N-acetyltransferase [Dehalococcoidia bacterium]|nr:GNAT family N-acetyltransferase [Dehalococcoidia bacterium]